MCCTVRSLAAVPQAPSAVRGEPDTNSVLLQWSPPLLGHADSYYVQYQETQEIDTGFQR